MIGIDSFVKRYRRARSTRALTRRQGWPLYALLAPSASFVLLAATLYGGSPAEPAEAATPEFDLPALLVRADRAERLWNGVEAFYEREIAPLELVLLRHRADTELARRVAVALVREAQRVAVEPQLLLAVLLVENPMLDPRARSPVGASGLMQVMPTHRGKWPCRGGLEEIEANICYGAQIFANLLRAQAGDIDRALLRYNGCVNGTNTPNCHTYPMQVYARAGRASLLAWLRPAPLRIIAP